MIEGTKLQKNILKWPKRYKVLLVGIIAILITNLMYVTGGSRTSVAQLFHIPIVLSTYFWRTRGGVISAIVFGILAGPLMPLNVEEGIMQTPTNWVVRLVVFAIVATFSGHVFDQIDRLHSEIREKDLTNPFTGLYNRNKFYIDATNNISKGRLFTVFTIKLINIDSIGKYVDPALVEKLINQLIRDLKLMHENLELYSYSDDEFILIKYPECNSIGFIEDLISKYATYFKIDDFEVRLPMKVGVYEYLGGNESPSKILDKARIAYEQAKEREYGIFYYNDKIEEEVKETFEIAASLPDAIKEKELFLVYQPKINLKDDSVEGVEILSRWNRGNRKPVGPNVFIRIAEEIGLIKDITHFVVEHAFNQISKWESKDIKINYSFNVTARELLDVDFIEWAEKLIETFNLERTNIEIELTERVLCEEGDKLTSVLKYLRKLGYKISVDDFGTGYNSLTTISEIPFDILKIDRYFINRLDRLEVREMIKSVISFAHRLDKIVVAEGIETKDQLDCIKKLGCDMAQGYYFSKPLLPEDFEQYLYG
ncbi:MAG: EAL domain-containing protein [Clostridiales bacterium]|nr:EAL domain-containing protein [Clostridiales bacterium]